MLILLNVNINKKRIYNYTHYTHRGEHLHLHQKNLTYYSTSKNITRKIFNPKRIQKENYNLKGENKNTNNQIIKQK